MEPKINFEALLRAAEQVVPISGDSWMEVANVYQKLAEEDTAQDPAKLIAGFMNLKRRRSTLDPEWQTLLTTIQNKQSAQKAAGEGSRTKTLTREQNDQLLDLVEEALPVTTQEWEAIAEELQKLVDEPTPRSALSLRKLCMKSYCRTDRASRNVDNQRAIAIKTKINAKSAGTAETAVRAKRSRVASESGSESLSSEFEDDAAENEETKPSTRTATTVVTPKKAVAMPKTDTWTDNDSQRSSRANVQRGQESEEGRGKGQVDFHPPPRRDTMGTREQNQQQVNTNLPPMRQNRLDKTTTASPLKLPRFTPTPAMHLTQITPPTPFTPPPLAPSSFLRDSPMAAVPAGRGAFGSTPAEVQQLMQNINQLASHLQNQQQQEQRPFTTDSDSKLTRFLIALQGEWLPAWQDEHCRRHLQYERESMDMLQGHREGVEDLMRLQREDLHNLVRQFQLELEM